MDVSALKLIVERAKTKGLIQGPVAPAPVPQPAGQSRLAIAAPPPTPQLGKDSSRARTSRLTKHVTEGIDMDFDLLATFLTVEINAEVSALRLQIILNKRLAEMRADGSFDKIPEVVLEMLTALQLPSFLPSRPKEFAVAMRNSCLVISGEGVESTLKGKSIQGLLKNCQWRIDSDELVLSGGFVTAFPPAQLRQIWNNCHAHGSRP